MNVANPYKVLGVDQSASDETIKSAYLERVKAHPPERDPEIFQRIRAAYESIENRRARVAFRLFDSTLPTLDDLMESAREPSSIVRPNFKEFETLLSANCPKR